jgi:hypothetical protein
MRLNGNRNVAIRILSTLMVRTDPLKVEKKWLFSIVLPQN